MNRKGMTLTEIIISVAILASIGLTIVFGLNRVFNRQADDDQLSFEDKILSSTDLYLSNNQNLVNDLQTNKGWIIITVDDLTSAGFINENLIDPSTNEKILTNEEIKVSLDADGLYKIEYKPDDVKEPYLEGRTLNLHFKQNFDCTKISSYETEWKSVNLRAVGTDSLVMDVNIHDVIKSIKCNVDTSKPGTYEIEYTYELPDEYITKTYKRSVVVGGDPTDIEKIRAVIKPVAPDQVFIIRKPVDLTVYGTNRQGEERILNPSEYSVTGANTNTIGTKTATINYTGQNSDGSKPKTTVIFEVVYDPADIVSITASANPNPVIIRKSVTFTVQGTRRNGSKVTLNSSQYSVSSYSTSTVGSKLITISYTGTNSDGSKPTTPITLQVIYDPSDVTSLSMTVSPTTVIINKSVSFTVVGTRRDGTKVTLTSSQYSLSGHSTSTVGSKTATATYTGTNSDGSKPTATAKFTVVYDPEDIVSISASASPNPVIIHGTVSFTVTGTKRGGGTRSIPSSQYSISSYSTSTIGNKSITITYTGTNTDGSKPTRVITLQVIYNPLDVTSCTLTLSPNPVIIGNSMSATVVGTRRNGTTFTMTSGQYTLSGISTSTLGTRTGRATLNSTNSDGSKPYCTRSYTVNPSQNDIVSISASVSPNPVILNGSYSFTVIGTRRS
ncbi:MAG TPA: hypothetical protein GX713_05195, partial [Mollicutes bacterium]|nr:hypothetical protein [Mollicutes bacterium]